MTALKPRHRGGPGRTLWDQAEIRNFACAREAFAVASTPARYSEGGGVRDISTLSPSPQFKPLVATF